VGELLIARKVEILPAVTHPINLEAQKLSKLDQNGNASKQRSSSASLKHHHVRIDKERRLREHISIQVLVGDAREDGAACAATNLVQVTTRQATKANLFARKHRSGRFASNLAKEDLKVLLRAFKDARVCIMKITASVGCCENGAELTWHSYKLHRLLTLAVNVPRVFIIGKERMGNDLIRWLLGLKWDVVVFTIHRMARHGATELKVFHQEEQGGLPL
jgi:hypothetical protein